MSIQLISYEDAAKMLNAGLSTIRRAVAKTQVLTRVALGGQKQFLIEGQVKLFKDKAQIRKTLLEEDEKREWEEYKKIAENYNAYKSGFMKSSSTEFDIPMTISETEYELEHELEKKMMQKALKQGRMYRKYFIAGAANKVPDEIVVQGKKKRLRQLNIEELTPLAVYIQGALKQEYDIDADRSDVMGLLVKTFCDMDNDNMGDTMLKLAIGVVIFSIILTSNPDTIIPENIGDIAKESLEEAMSEMAV